MNQPQQPNANIVIEQGDITLFDGDAIVNAANAVMLGGGGVDGAIHKMAGPSLTAACYVFPTDHQGHRCPTGAVRVTPGFNLQAKFVIHTVGPVYKQMDPAEAERILRLCYQRCLLLASAMGLDSIALPAISTGAYGYPVADAAKVALEVARAKQWPLDIMFVIFTDDDFEIWTQTLAALEQLP